MEDRCMGKGDANCHVHLRSADEWDKMNGDSLSSFKRVELDAAIQEVAEAIKRSEQKLEKHRRKLVALAGEIDEYPEIVTRSEGMRRVVALAKTVAKVDSTILITGESDTGIRSLPLPAHNYGPTPPLRDVEREYIIKNFDENQGNRKETAKVLGIGVATLHRKLKAYGGFSRTEKQPSNQPSEE